MRIAVVVPTIREACIIDFLDQWEQEFANHDCTVYIVEDNNKPTFQLEGYDFKMEHLTHLDIQPLLGKHAWIIPRKTDCVRSIGFYKAYMDDADYILTLDDDCYPTLADCDTNERSLTFIGRHLAMLEEPVENKRWASTVQGLVPRGVPYESLKTSKPTILSHGGWLNVPDLDAVSQMTYRGAIPKYIMNKMDVPYGMYYPMCGMNIMFRRELVPAMYFLLMGSKYPFDRFGDIWAGVFTKKIIDYMGYAVRIGGPNIDHKRASNQWTNLRKEYPGYLTNEELWGVVDHIHLSGDSFAECYMSLAEQLPINFDNNNNQTYWHDLKKAMKTWAGLFIGDKK